MLEYCSGGNLGEFLKSEHWRFIQLDSEDGFIRHCLASASILIGQALSGLAFLEIMGIVNLDIKPENLILKTEVTDVIKEALNACLAIIDFGEAKDVTDGKHHSAGTEHFTAPE